MKKIIKVKNVEFKAPKKESYNKTELSKGKKIEGEHTKNKKVKEIISKNHLDEDPNYYKKLKKVEKRK